MILLHKKIKNNLYVEKLYLNNEMNPDRENN